MKWGDELLAEGEHQKLIKHFTGTMIKYNKELTSHNLHIYLLNMKKYIPQKPVTKVRQF